MVFYGLKNKTTKEQRGDCEFGTKGEGNFLSGMIFLRDRVSEKCKDGD